MTDLPERLFLNPVWHALHTKHRDFALEAGEACRYPADVAPFAAVGASSVSAGVEELNRIDTLKCLQMVLPDEVKPPEREMDLVPLSIEDAPAMVALTDVAFPGFFRSRTYAMGSYFGIRAEGKLIAMGGERLKLDGYPEVSGVCTHPDHRGKGYAASLIWEVVRKHRRDGDVSWLHVASANRRAIELYHRMGFVTSREVTLHRVTRKS